MKKQTAPYKYPRRIEFVDLSKTVLLRVTIMNEKSEKMIRNKCSTKIKLVVSWSISNLGLIQ